jgi:UDP-N-acetyl-D-mannosaminuronic acid dehydrogenase
MTSKDSNSQTVCTIGLGYVGLTLSIALADVGFRVIGVEKSSAVLESISVGEPHFHEDHLAEHLRSHLSTGLFSVHPSIPAELPIDVFIVTVGTPLDASMHIRLDSIIAATRTIRDSLRGGALIILRSTVKIGTTRHVVKPILDESGLDYSLAFCPERTLEGNAMRELRTLPQIICGVDELSVKKAARIFSALTPKLIKLESVEAGEMVKLVNNTYRDITFAFANEVAEMSEALGLNAIEVIRAAGQDYERGKLPIPGLVGGACLEKDPVILADSLSEIGYQPQITTLARRLNANLPYSTVKSIQVGMKSLGFDQTKVKKVSILGVAFKGKPATDDVRGSMARPIMNAIMNNFPNAEIYGYDALVKEKWTRELGLEYAPSLESAFQDAQIVVIQNNHSVFASMDIEHLAMLMARPGLIYDYWNQFTLEGVRMPEGVLYTGLGSMSNSLTAYGVKK